MERLIRYDWPGNVRELEGVIQRVLVLADGDLLAPTDLPAELRPSPLHLQATSWPAEASLAEVEAAWINLVLARYGGNKTQAARQLGIDPAHRRA